MRPQIEQIDFYGNDEQFDEDNIEYLRMVAPETMEAKLADELTPEQVNQYNESNNSNMTKEQIAEEITNSFFRISKNNEVLVLDSIEKVQAYIKEREIPETGDLIKDNILQSFHQIRDYKVRITPQILFKIAKDSLQEVEREKLKEKLEGFAKIFNITAKTGQLALNESAMENITRIARKLEVATLGYSKFVEENAIKSFLYKCDFAFFKPFTEFPRLVPDDVLKKLHEAQSKGVFDEFWVLYLDYSKQKIKSTAQKVKEKDPILFGKVLSDDTDLFYIADWIDEYCDLTLDKFVVEMKKILPNYTIPEVKMPTPKDIAGMLEQKKRLKETFAKTNSKTYKQIYKDLTTSTKKDFVSKFLGIFKSVPLAFRKIVKNS